MLGRVETLSSQRALICLLLKNGVIFSVSENALGNPFRCLCMVIAHVLAAKHKTGEI